jgi:hypothetical protein
VRPEPVGRLCFYAAWWFVSLPCPPPPASSPQLAAATRFQRAWRAFTFRKHLKTLLRDGWQKLWSEEYGAYYYVCAERGVTTWEMPPGLKNVQLPIVDGPLVRSAQLLDAARSERRAAAIQARAALADRAESSAAVVGWGTGAAAGHRDGPGKDGSWHGLTRGYGGDGGGEGDGLWDVAGDGEGAQTGLLGDAFMAEDSRSPP